MVLLPPVGGRRQQRMVRQAIVAFAAGSVLGGLVSASGLLVVAGLFSELLTEARVVVLGITVTLAVALQAGVVGVRLPSPSHIIPQTTFGHGMVSGMLRFGFELGLGFRTQIPTVAPYVLAAVVVLGGTVPSVAALAFGWGIGRAAAFSGRAGLVVPDAEDSRREAVLTRYEMRMARLGSTSVWVLLVVLPVWCVMVLVTG
ncbi:hypothetical protein DVS28_a2901 [Euzebya pacifica]|uniref:Uncharacterized protein n=1 Tax=Euzebya pacifica TaxID=1608957 RepID=A0A346XZD3_9ACTN|nr:hypothetical protein [Euzebya pacifica]AXV07580.1 hypothetical protein DVS28_a2901 [Euzebya pacifica]